MVRRDSFLPLNCKKGAGRQYKKEYIYTLHNYRIILIMKFHPAFNPNIIVITGTWDPLLPRHMALFKELLRYSKKKALNPYILIFYPTPANYIFEGKFKEYFDLDARIAFFKHLGFNNLIVTEFETADLKRSSAEFLNELTRQTGISIRELWVGENQQFGAGAQGFLSIRHECASRGINLRVLKNSFLVNLDKESFYRDFNAGKFGLSSAIVGYFPTYKLKKDGKINIHDGIYSAKLRKNPFDKAKETGIIIKIKDQRPEEFTLDSNYNWLVLIEKIEESPQAAL